MYWTIVTGALGDPSTSPCCGIPLNSRCTVSANGNAFLSEPIAGVVLDDDELLPPTASAIPTMTPAITSPATAAMPSTFGDALRRAPFRATGGGAATACCLCRRACLPLI